jgi:hypothetical protein
VLDRQRRLARHLGWPEVLAWFTADRADDRTGPDTNMRGIDLTRARSGQRTPGRIEAAVRI